MQATTFRILMSSVHENIVGHWYIGYKKVLHYFQYIKIEKNS